LAAWGSQVQIRDKNSAVVHQFCVGKLVVAQMNNSTFLRLIKFYVGLMNVWAINIGESFY